jgi:peptide/nickel transport system permease protein
MVSTMRIRVPSLRRVPQLTVVRLLVRRVFQASITLFLLSVLVFADVHLLPGDIARRILGPLADPRAIAQLDHQLGADRPLMVQYWDWLRDALTGDLGQSYAFRRPVTDLLGPAVVASVKLAAVAFLIVVPVSIVGGVIAALNRDRLLDRVITIGGLSATTIPEFVWGVLAIAVFGLWLHVLPVTAQAPPGATLPVQVEHLLLPAFCLVLVLFGHIARMTRAGTIEALDSDYTRTAVLKGLPRWTVIRRHVLRNALLPTVAVVAVHSGYLIGGIVAIEFIFNYDGLGQLLFHAAQQKDFPLLQSAVLVTGGVYLCTTLIADVLYSFLNPRLRMSAQAS